MLSLLDTDLILMRAATSSETEIDWGEDNVWSLYMDMEDAKASVRQQIDTICKAVETDNFICCLTDPNANFRKVVDPEYKSNRRKNRKPVGYKALFEWVKDEYPSAMRPQLEADDVMSIIQTAPHNKGQTIIVSSDKDMKTVPGSLYDPGKDEFHDISEASAFEFFLTQVLAGDPVDNIRGIPGIGPVKAKAILGSRPSWGAVEQAYIKAGMTREDAIKQARLVRILHHSDWDEKKETVRLWQPSDTKNT